MRVVLLSDEPNLADGAARLLATQWPSSGVTGRRSALMAHCRKAKQQELPCHLLILDDEGDAESPKVIGHCRLQPACENADGFSAAITSVVVDPAYRGKGIGRMLLKHAEETVAGMGFGYLYLWTHDAQAFYLACGYSECEKVSLLRPALVALGTEAVGKLEALFAKKAQVATCGGEGGDAASNDESAVRADSTWFRKRLLELATSSLAPLTPSEIDTMVRDALQHHGDRSDWIVTFAPLAWERQIGPCCGLAALRMARVALRNSSDRAEAAAESAVSSAALLNVDGGWSARIGGDVELQLAGNLDSAADESVLRAAIERGFSSDGEVFDIHHLATLAADVCGLNATVVRVDADSSNGGANSGATATAAATRLGAGLAAWVASGGLAVVPYDKHEANHMPVHRGGKMAHYLIVHGTASIEGAAETSAPPLRLICAHGLSRRPLVVTAAELYASNSQLLEMKQSTNTKKWVVGEAGVRLAQRLLLLSGPAGRGVGSGG